MNWDEEVDFVSVGAGAGGLTAAITAAHAGLRALVLEKSPKLGGVTGRSLGEVWIGASAEARAAGIIDSPEDALAYLTFISEGHGDERLRKALIEHALAAVAFLRENADLELSPIPGLSDYFYPIAPGSKDQGRYLEASPFKLSELGDLRDLVEVSPHGFAHNTGREEFGAASHEELVEAIRRHREADEVCAGTALSSRLVKAAAAKGVQLRVNHAATRLITEDGHVIGVEVQTPDGIRAIRTPGVLLATSGYDWNPDMVRDFEHLDVYHGMTPPSVTGDHITMATEVGAALYSRPAVLTPLVFGMHIPGEQLDGAPMYRYQFAGQPHTILVNEGGRRFADESFFPDVDAAVAAFDGTNVKRPNWPFWLVFDQNFLDKYALGSIRPGDPMPENFGFEGSTPRELAERAGIDPEGLEQTISIWNMDCAEGTDSLFQRGRMPYAVQNWADYRMPNPVLGPIDKAPLYALKLEHIGLGLPTTGLKIDEVGRVLTYRNVPIPGLYAAGNAAAAQDVPGYQSGLANARGLTYGYLAALDVAKQL